MPVEPSLGKKTADHIRRLILRQVSRPEIKGVDAEIPSADVTHFTLANTSNVRRGSREKDADFTVNVDGTGIVQPKSKVVSASLLPKTDLTIRPSVDNDRVNFRSTSVYNATLGSQLLQCYRTDVGWGGADDVQSPQFEFRCNTFLPNGGFLIRRKSTVLGPTNVAIAVPKVSSSVHSVTRGQLAVYYVPEEIELLVPLVRRREQNPSAGSAAERTFWLKEKQLLAAVVGNNVGAQDIQIISVFRRVPLAAVARIEMGREERNLCMYLRPSSGNMVQSGSRRTYTIAFGRVCGQAQIVRVLVPD
jgi:hypothetical protein